MAAFMPPFSTRTIRVIGAALTVGCWLAFGRAGRAAETDPWSYHITAVYAYDSLDTVLRQLEETTGCAVTCPADAAELARTQWRRGNQLWQHRPDLPRYPVSARTYLDAVCADLALAWTYYPESRSITLEIPWRRTDPRSPEELLQFAWKHGDKLEKDQEWQDAFNALLCKEGNIAKARAVRQKAMTESLFFGVFGSRAPAMKVVLRDPVVDAAGHRYVLFVMDQPIAFYPGHGSASYYWFKEDGTLAGAGIFNTGHRCSLMETRLLPETGDRPGGPSAIQMILEWNVRSLMTAEFKLADASLQLTHLIDAQGEEQLNQSKVGQSLFAPEEIPTNEGANPSQGTFVIEVPKEVDPRSLTIATHVGRPMKALDFGFSIVHLKEKIDGARCTVATGHATFLKAIIFSPRYQTKLIDVKSLDAAPSRSITAEMTLLASVPFAGKIDFPEGADPAQYSLEVTYYGQWAEKYLNDFGGTQQPSFVAAKVDLQADGSFISTVPDVAHDPSIAGFTKDSAFTLVLRDKRTGHVPYDLKVGATTASDVPIGGPYDALKLRAVPWPPEK